MIGISPTPGSFGQVLSHNCQMALTMARTIYMNAERDLCKAKRKKSFPPIGYYRGKKNFQLVFSCGTSRRQQQSEGKKKFQLVFSCGTSRRQQQSEVVVVRVASESKV